MHPADAAEVPKADSAHGGSGAPGAGAASGGAGTLAAGTSPAPAEAPTSPPPPTAPMPAIPGGWSRRKKIMAWVAGSLAVVLLLAATGGYLVYQHLNANLHQVNVNGLLGTRPVDLHPQAENILVLGSDTRHGQGRGYGSAAQLNTDHSDTLLIVHIAANRKWADVMAIPRDS